MLPCCVYRVFILGFFRVYSGLYIYIYMGIVEKKMETSSLGLRGVWEFRVLGLGFRDLGLRLRFKKLLALC